MSKLSEKGLSACFSLWLSTFLVHRDLRSPTEVTASRLEGGDVEMYDSVAWYCLVGKINL